jgi:hypothetical protein
VPSFLAERLIKILQQASVENVMWEGGKERERKRRRRIEKEQKW